MPFRTDFFGSPHAQPGTEAGEIDDLMADRYGGIPPITGARLSTEIDETFKVTGSLVFGPLDDDENTYIEDLSFDGFETVDDARAWLTGELGIDEDDIEEEDG